MATRLLRLRWQDAERGHSRAYAGSSNSVGVDQMSQDCCVDDLKANSLLVDE